MWPPGNHKPANAKVHRPRSELRVGRNSAHHGQPEGQEEEEGKLSRGRLGADVGGGPDDGTQHHGRGRDEYGNGEHFNPSFHYEYPPFVGRGDRLASESYIFTRSPWCLASSSRVSANRFSSFPADLSLLPGRHLDPPSGAGNTVS